ncbi:hypothetical protein [Roseitranquillus sediminis]|uniref:hypothetical protein n=1 Tax=Roseitranquillus sediminis TaxID=2809051 RepID=UPI001D0C62DB|nr:hypothetical protein [Roseitranquillus sediminis]MBM9594060.1 hypothetical protein [Roseitranquillus sediminis]
MTRRVTATAALALVAALVLLDVAGSAPMNPFQAPPLLALGSGEAAGGAHCAALPTAD